MKTSRPRLVALLTAVSLCLFAAAPAADAAPGAVRVGEAPSLPAGAVTLGAAPEGQQLHLFVALEPSDPAGLEQLATEIATPGSAHFREPLSVAEFAARFGASRGAVGAVRSALADRGLSVGPLGANRLALPVTATVAEAEAAFGTELDRVGLPGGETAVTNVAAPALPAAVAGDVEAIVGLSNTARPHSQARAIPPAPILSTGSSGAETSAAEAAAGPQPCQAAIKAGNANLGSFLANETAEAYELDGLYAEGDLGAGQSVAVLEFEPFSQADVAGFQSCYGTSVPVVEEDIEGGPGPYAGKPHEAEEADLDIEQIAGLAPRIDKLIVYQAPNDGSEVAILDRWVEKDEAKVLSSSWGTCEPHEEPATQQAIATRLQEAAVQGQSFFASSGDEGSEDCYEAGKGGAGDEELAVDSPASQPFATAVGGTRLDSWEGPTRSEYLWNGGKTWGAGGGGVSALWSMPSYQAAAAPALGVHNGSSSGIPCKATPGHCREVPDVAANGAAETPYIFFEEGKWTPGSGSSAAAPVWAALAALVNANPGCRGETIGFANPALYEIAGLDYAANFHDVVAGEVNLAQTNDMLFGGKLPFQAKTGYDMATGLGAPNGLALAASLCNISGHHYSVTVTNPGDRLAIVGAPVSVQVTATDSGHATLTYSATGLPEGLAIDPATGLVSGAARTTGQSRVTVTARDPYGNVGSTAFTWTVGPGAQARRLLAATIAGLAQGKPRLTVAVAATDGETLRNVSIALPAGVSLAPADADVRAGASARDERARHLGARVSTPGKKVRFDFKRGAHQAHLRLGNRALDVSPKLVREARRGHLGTLAVKVSVADTAGHGRLRLALNP